MESVLLHAQEHKVVYLKRTAPGVMSGWKPPPARTSRQTNAQMESIRFNPERIDSQYQTDLDGAIHLVPGRGVR